MPTWRAQAGAGVATVDHRPHLHPAGLHRRACAFPADAGHRLLRRRAARLAEHLHLSGRDQVLQPAARPPHRAAVPRRDGAARHDDGRRLLLGAQGIGRGLLRRSRRAQHAGHRRQGDDGPQRAGGRARHAAIRLRRFQGADRRMARQGPAALCGHAALRHHLVAGADGDGRRAACRASRPAHADASVGKPRRDRLHAGALSVVARLYRRLRALRAARAKEPVRPLHPSVRTRGRRAVGQRLGRGVLPDLQPVPRLRACSTTSATARARSRCGSPRRPMSAAAPTIRCCAPWTRATR